MDPEQQNENNENAEVPTGNENPTEQQSPFTPNPEPEPTPEPSKSSPLGPIVGIIIIIILIILAGFYFWGSSLQETVNQPEDEPAMTEDENGAAGTVLEGSPEAGTFDDTSGTEVGLPLSESDEITDIEAELDDTDLENLDAELESIDAEFNNP